MDTLIMFGTEVKALGQGRVGGHLVLFGDPSNTDLARDYFTSNTDYGPATSSSVLYNHGLDRAIGKRRLTAEPAELKADNAGIWISAQLAMRDDYERKIYDMAAAGKLGWSSGTAPHLVARKRVGPSFEVLSWPLGLDASLTPAPAEPRTSALPLKSWAMEQYLLDDASGDTVDLDPAVIGSIKTRLLRSMADEVKTERDFESFLRDAGFSRSQATAITAAGYKAISTQRDAGEGLADLVASIKSATSTLTS